MALAFALPKSKSCHVKFLNVKQNGNSLKVAFVHVY